MPVLRTAAERDEAEGHRIVGRVMACHQNERHAVADRHCEKIAGGGERHHRREQRQLDRFSQHGHGEAVPRFGFSCNACSRRRSSVC